MSALWLTLSRPLCLSFFFPLSLRSAMCYTPPPPPPALPRRPGSKPSMISSPVLVVRVGVRTAVFASAALPTSLSRNYYIQLKRCLHAERVIHYVKSFPSTPAPNYDISRLAERRVAASVSSNSNSTSYYTKRHINDAFAVPKIIAIGMGGIRVAKLLSSIIPARSKLKKFYC